MKVIDILVLVLAMATCLYFLVRLYYAIRLNQIEIDIENATEGVQYDRAWRELCELNNDGSLMTKKEATKKKQLYQLIHDKEG